MNKKCREIDEQLTQILERAKGEEDEVMERINKNESVIRKAQHDLECAAREGIETEYQTAQQTLESAERESKYLKTRLAYLQRLDLITGEDYNSYVAEINREFDKVETDTRAELAALCDRMCEIYESFKEEVKETNALLAKLQLQVYRGQDIPEGESHVIAHRKKVDGRNTLAWGEIALRSHPYLDYKGLPHKLIGAAR